jgi:DtxR family Mn-dependent transcriptional regulator
MSGRGLVEAQEGWILLTSAGTDAALHTIRAHRLWETYLADATGFAESSWHHQAEHLEHSLTPSELIALDAKLSYPTHDPHGDPIPTATGTVVYHGGKPLPEMALNVPLRIVHLEDEPDTVYAQLVAEGLMLGQDVRIVEKAPRRIRFWANGDEHVLAPIVAGNISVVPVTKPSGAERAPGQRLSDLKLGEAARVANISPACRRMERHRFLDLGILPGTIVSAEMVSPGGDPTAYRIRDALIALRREQADLIYVTLEKEHITDDTED